MSVAGATTGAAVLVGFLIAFSGSGLTALTIFFVAFLTAGLTLGFAVGFAVGLTAGLTRGLTDFGDGFTPFLMTVLRPCLTTGLAAALVFTPTGLALAAGFLTATGFPVFLAAGLAAFTLLALLVTFAAGLGAVFVLTADLFAGLALDLAAALVSAIAGILAFFAGTLTVCLL